MRRFVALPLLALLAACAGESAVSNLQPPGYLREAPQIAAAADWSAAQTVTVQVVNHAFVPDDLRFRRDRPVKLVLENRSDSDHTFVSQAFFQTIAVHKLVTPEVGLEAAWVEKVVIPARRTVELWFVPARYGAFTYECTMPGHALLGMKGTITVD